MDGTAELTQRELQRLAHYRAAVRAGFYTDDCSNEVAYGPEEQMLDEAARVRLCYLKLAIAICRSDEG